MQYRRVLACAFLTSNRVIAALVIVGACSRHEPVMPTHVHVSEDGACTVARLKLDCASAGQYLRSKLQLGSDEPVVVRVEGVRDSELRGRRVADLLRENGYSNVAIVGVLSEPDHDSR